MKAKYRTERELWGIMDYPVVLVSEAKNSFILTGYASESASQSESPQAGIYDVMEFEIFS